MDSQISQLQGQIDTLQSRNGQLNGLIDYFKTNDFVEQEARTKLNLRKPGEQIIIVPESASAKLNNQFALPKGFQITSGANPQKWLAYFFNQIN